MFKKAVILRGCLEGSIARVIYTRNNLVYVQIGSSKIIPYAKHEVRAC